MFSPIQISLPNLTRQILTASTSRETNPTRSYRHVASLAALALRSPSQLIEYTSLISRISLVTSPPDFSQPLFPTALTVLHFSHNGVRAALLPPGPVVDSFF